MALTSKWNLVKDAEVEQSLTFGGRIVRTGIVKGITAGVAASKVALLNVVNTAPGIYALGDSFDPSLPEYICVYTVARAIPNTGGSMAWVWQHFETPTGNGTPIETFAAEDSTVLVCEPTNVMPGDTKQILCSTTGTAPDYTSPNDTTDRPITVNFPRTLRSLILYGLFSERPSGTVLGATNKVNSATWNGLAKGFWRCEGTRVRWSNKDGLYSVTTGFLTRQDIDWSTYAVPTLPNGELARVDSDDLEYVQSQPYGFGITFDLNGLWSAGMYKEANFSSIFGDTFAF